MRDISCFYENQLIGFRKKKKKKPVTCLIKKNNAIVFMDCLSCHKKGLFSFHGENKIALHKILFSPW